MKIIRSEDIILWVARAAKQYVEDGVVKCACPECWRVQADGWAQYSGDGGPALEAQIRGGPLGVDSHGNLFLLDAVNNLVRVLDDKPPVVTFEDPLPAPNERGWHNTTVAIPFIATDTGAGIGSTNPSSPLVLTAEGSAISGKVTAIDRAGNTAHFTSHVVRIDTHGPVISGMPATGLSLWPPDGKMLHVATVTAFDDNSGVLPGSFQVTGTSNEPSNSAQISIIPDGFGGFEIWLEAARSQSGHGRTYTLTANASDCADNVSMVTTVCVVRKHHDAA